MQATLEDVELSATGGTRVFGADHDRALADLRTALERGDGAHAARLAHRLRGMAANYALQELCETLRQIEAEPAPWSAPERIARVSDEAAAAFARLRAAAGRLGLTPTAPAGAA